jgi:hypothetical protein
LLNLFDTDGYAKEYEMIAEGIELGGKRNREWRTKFDERRDAKIELLKEFQRRIEKHLVEPNPNQVSDFWALIHPEIIAVTKSRFETGHYADCAEAAFRQINSVVKGLVKTAIGKELDGAGLMKTAFRLTIPLLKLRELRPKPLEIFSRDTWRFSLVQ